MLDYEECFRKHESSLIAFCLISVKQSRIHKILVQIQFYLNHANFESRKQELNHFLSYNYCFRAMQINAKFWSYSLLSLCLSQVNWPLSLFASSFLHGLIIFYFMRFLWSLNGIKFVEHLAQDRWLSMETEKSNKGVTLKVLILKEMAFKRFTFQEVP